MEQNCNIFEGQREWTWT